MLTERPTRCIPMKIIWITLGCLCLILGTIGIVLPVLPTVPFYMLTGFCFARSSPKLLNWFYQTQAISQLFGNIYPKTNEHMENNMLNCR